jgi:hypothetical protein
MVVAIVRHVITLIGKEPPLFPGEKSGQIILQRVTLTGLNPGEKTKEGRFVSESCLLHSFSLYFCISVSPVPTRDQLVQKQEI